MIEKTILIETIFNVLNESGLDYCVQNNYNMMPDYIPSDIDIFYRDANEKKLDSIITNIASKTNLVITQKIPNGYLQIAYMFSHVAPEKDFLLQLDFYTELSSKAFPHCYMSSEMLKNKRFFKCFYVPDYYDEIIYQIVRRIMKKDMSIEHIDIIRQLFVGREQINTKLEKQFGLELFIIIDRMLTTRNTSYFYDNYDAFYKYLNQICSKNSSFKKWLLQKKFELFTILPQRVINPCGMSVAFIAPDGAGKSSVIEEITKTCAGSFHGIEHKYFRPRLFKNPGHYNLINPNEEAKDNPNPHGRPLNNYIKSIVRFLFYNIDFLLGTFLIIYPYKLKKKLVIFDRYYYDYYVDLRRYQYRLPHWFPRFFSFMIPSPDLVFVLDAPGEVLFNRKQELSVAELRRQRKDYKKLVTSLKNAFLIDAKQPLKKVVEDVSKIIVEKKSNMTKLKFH